jgi:hypothetical protein
MNAKSSSLLEPHQTSDGRFIAAGTRVMIVRALSAEAARLTKLIGCGIAGLYAIVSMIRDEARSRR